MTCTYWDSRCANEKLERLQIKRPAFFHSHSYLFHSYTTVFLTPISTFFIPTQVRQRCVGLLDFMKCIPLIAPIIDPFNFMFTGQATVCWAALGLYETFRRRRGHLGCGARGGDISQADNMTYIYGAGWRLGEERMLK